ncbi:DUF4846 domain-containing protein [Acanthopleuribacter pedis]|uniref:DUF4846 domain-containing protein n=1 Tax=Acanthopleuribacter pedis TaxID=442870 RepID=A0A8J7QDP3_9BACT|nr:DUF4846 domain-containing protein [Acanthopleuribacter pedis]MBO1321889.1 DUF4846 domain-containing protein [Acanthopleuribacter pedis]
MTGFNRIALAGLLLSLAILSAQDTAYAWPHQTDGGTLAERFPAPEGYHREPFNDETTRWLRGLPLKPGVPPVRFFDGRRKPNDVHLAVVDIDVGQRDLQQCADAVMRLRAEYLWSQQRRNEIAFNFTSGDKARWSDWAEGQRPRINGNKVSWSSRAAANASYPIFRRYLNTVFTYAGSYSLAKELKKVADPGRILPGDVFIIGGFPGHAVIVLDVVANAAGERLFLLGQSYMPAQDFHVLKNLKRGDGWYPASAEGTLKTPEWTFSYSDLKRFENR